MSSQIKIIETVMIMAASWLLFNFTGSPRSSPGRG